MSPEVVGVMEHFLSGDGCSVLYRDTDISTSGAERQTSLFGGSYAMPNRGDA